MEGEVRRVSWRRPSRWWLRMGWWWRRRAWRWRWRWWGRRRRRRRRQGSRAVTQCGDDSCVFTFLLRDKSPGDETPQHYQAEQAEQHEAEERPKSHSLGRPLLLALAHTAAALTLFRIVLVGVVGAHEARIVFTFSTA
eukprot:3434740-Prymnesium_polylepis.2